MDLLIIGGTRFLGRAIVDAALERGHTLTLFNRGQSNPGLYPDLEHIVGDRDGGLEALDGRRWDAVIDTCGYVPRIVGASAKYLSPVIDHYTFISTMSVYADPSQVGINEDGELCVLDDPTTEDVTGGSYGGLKVLCEEAVTETMNGRALLVRSGLIVGPHDLSDRFSYWPYRVARGGDILAPGEPDAAVQFIDVRDIAGWVVEATEQRLTGPYNVTGPNEPLTMGQFLAECQAVVDAPSTLTWVDDAFLLEHEVQPYLEMPLWVPAESAGFSTFDLSKAQATGLQTRPLTETITDTLDWLGTRPSDHAWRGGLSPERESELLAAWRAANAL
ncbi:MAG: epimerase [Chloroflexota bacterium]